MKASRLKKLSWKLFLTYGLLVVLIFFAGDYLRASGASLPEPAFLDQVPIRFGMAEETHYHVPLLISPYGYSTYRGS